MEKALSVILDNVRLDAIAKLRNADIAAKEQHSQLIDAATEIMTFANLARREGLLALEDAAKRTKSDFLRQLVILVVDGTCPEIIAEIGTNFYWTKAPDGEDAMADYLFLRGMLAIQDGENPRALEKILLSLMPAAQRQEYWEQIEGLHQSAGVERLFEIHPSFQDTAVWEPIHRLENTVSGLDNRCVQRVLRGLDNRDLAICLYVFEQDVRKKLLSNLSAGLAQAIVEDVALCASYSEQEVSACMRKVQDVIRHLQETGELCVSPVSGDTSCNP